MNENNIDFSRKIRYGWICLFIDKCFLGRMNRYDLVAKGLKSFDLFMKCIVIFMQVNDSNYFFPNISIFTTERSEERRVGKECRSRLASAHEDEKVRRYERS